MVIRGFRNRKKELSSLEGILKSNRFEFMIVYGRRRVGKTELVLKATENKKRLYYLATTENNLERFYRQCVEFDEEFSSLRKDYEVLFEMLSKKAEVIVIDEFQNMIKETPGILSIMQVIVDIKLRKSKTKLILLGSSVSIMSSKVLSYQSPLYGRKTGSFKLNPVTFFELKEFFPNSRFMQLMDIYSFADGIPYYLVKLGKDFWKWLEREIKDEKSFITDEIDFLMRYEFDNPSMYRLIVEAISNGKTTVNEIRGFVKAQRTDLSPYLKNLIEVGIIRREVPITEKINSRAGRYYLNDNFINFWFRFIYPNLSSIQGRMFDPKTIKRDHTKYLGYIFESVCTQYMIYSKKFKFGSIGRWWHKDKEIDIVALDNANNSIIFGECKWKENVSTEEILKHLKEKAGFVLWNKDGRNETYVVFARSFKKKTSSYEGKKIICIDIKDIEKDMLNKNNHIYK